ncbi:hypothetical protein DUNSADRAFT_13944 [Dunaliella salina]|uniref:Uncharacterized protein n=1 Tax=Dunaliella salina TaxID=3046 RepID=A0ABQ7G8C6_DUNSA|nr:hypothetical protein DUNSADRAFT_13944 [Dunaliella salina]|eukprot:KAF5830865.1 hypothetical protein DUNSADRAFT_13944 [Dunaliella salina]
MSALKEGPHLLHGCCAEISHGRACATSLHEQASALKEGPHLLHGCCAESPNGRGVQKRNAALSELKAGPSEEQKRHKEAARAQLARDLEDQIRQKREREAKQKAEEAAQVEKEEAELRAYHAQIEAQKEEERRAARAQEQAKEMQKAKMAEEQRASSEQVFKSAKGPARRGNKKLIEADWLDAPKQPPAASRSDMEASKSGAGMDSGFAQERAMGGRKSTGPQRGSVNSREGMSFGNSQPDEGSTVVQSKASQAHSRAKSEAKSDWSDVDANGIAQLLAALQAEQARLREDFARQADAMDRLAKDAGAAALERDKAWQEVERVRGALAGHSAMAPSPSSGDPKPGWANLNGAGWNDGQARASVNEARQSIREALHAPLKSSKAAAHEPLLDHKSSTCNKKLSTPLEASWAAAREPLLVHKSRSSDRPLHGSPPEPELLNLEAQGSFGEDGLGEENAYMYAGPASPPRQARLQFSDDLWQDDPGSHHVVHSYGLEPMPSASPLQLAGQHNNASPSMIPKPPTMQAKRQQSRGNSFFHGLDASREVPGAKRLPLQPPPIDVSVAGRRKNMDRGRSPAILTSNHMPSPQEGGRQGGRGRAVGGGGMAGESLGGAPARQYSERPAVSKTQQQRLQEQKQQRLEPHMPKKAGVGAGGAGGVGVGRGGPGPSVGNRGVGAGGTREEVGSSALLQQQRLDQRRSQQQQQQQQQQRQVDDAGVGLERQRTPAAGVAAGRASEGLALRVPSAEGRQQGPSSLSSGPPSHPSKQPMRRGWDAPLAELELAQRSAQEVSADEGVQAGPALSRFSAGGLSASKQQSLEDDPVFLAHSTLPIHRVDGHLSMGEVTMDDVGAAAATAAAQGAGSKPGADGQAEETEEEYTPVASPA